MSQRPTLLPPSTGSFSIPTPSGLTPNTRSEAEAALSYNSFAQTDSAAPDPELFADRSVVDNDNGSDAPEALQAYRRPGVMRTSSTNYQNALKEAHKASVSSDMSTDTDVPDNVTGAETVASPTSSTVPFPPAGQGVVPNYGFVTGQPEATKKSRSRGLSLGSLARQQSWSEQDFKRVYNADILSEEPKKDGGYASGDDGKTAGS
ncbi:hypothetical protein P153DRAFT_54614 [Dothidotthia symphoricarpi CBS 119687]|uniref:Uncharacterized protein n=1 Tax=Dothidotthia symphoricarpi CBS 119687 TaxID=1392245 RepID=A0A6A6AA60_9PLEO|nr:uncharacterized protein P153DRAFT_54614 [Dothidotthia symphoricarpi CBS 119687]KAF2127737.1 hypothetical protein P153DRAFT_54614 [Dothidotthia symphoricarpi CBS 119687]